MALSIRARIAVFGALVVCGTVAMFGLLLFLAILGGGRATVDQDLWAARPNTTFSAEAGPDGVLRPVRQGGQGPIPTRLPVPLRLNTPYTVSVARNDDVRVIVQPAPTGGYLVTGEHLGEVERTARALLTYLLVTAVVAMMAGVATIWLVAGRALGPLRTMAAVAEEVGWTRDLRRRLPPVQPRDEVGRLTEAFNAMLGRLEDAQESQRRFVADASHELRTPLTTIRSNAGLLRREPPLEPGDAREAVVDIAAESERMSRLVDGLLTLARADAGQELRRAPLDLAQVAEPVARRAGLDASLESAPVLGDADALTQLAWILADNARRHGGGTGTMWVRPRPPGGATLIVGDRGPGIPPGEEERIFERFYQTGASRSDGGSGLGLAIARWIVGQHGGRIWAGNAPDPAGGAIFVVEL